MEILVNVILELINQFVTHKEKKSGKIYWGARITFMGIILTGFGIFLTVLLFLYHSDIETYICGLGILFGSGILSLALGVFLINNP